MAVPDTDFHHALKAPFSEALEIVRIATDPKLERRGDIYPPLMTAAEFAGYIAARSDTINYGNVSQQERARKEAELTRTINKRLLTWTGEEFFEQVPLPMSEDENTPVSDIGFRITPAGMRAADNPLRDHGVALLGRADAIARHLKQASTTV